MSFMIWLWHLYLCWWALYLGFASGKQLQMYLTLNLLIVPLKLMNLLTGWDLNVCFVGSEPVWAVSLSQQGLRETVRATLAWAPLDQVLWPLQIRVSKHERGIRESTSYPKGKKICRHMMQPLNLRYICPNARNVAPVSSAFLPPSPHQEQLFVGTQLFWGSSSCPCPGTTPSMCPWP